MLCGGLAAPAGGHSQVLPLSLHGPSPNVRLRIQDISRRLVANIPDVLVDLLEVASYVYAADSAIPRGGKTDARMGSRWRRKLRFVIPVRCPEVWASTSISSALVETLSFLSDDDYELEFIALKERPAMQSYLEFSGENIEAFTPDEVILFSGGLDSFAGTVEELIAHRKSVALVSHRSASKIAAAQKDLVKELRARLGAARVLHVPVWADLDGSLSRELTHRTRSFLFAALGAVTARLFGLDRIVFFENGIVSLNLPPVAQVVGARATRTTHPQALAGFRKVLAALLGRPFEVANPYSWLTKREVVERIAALGFGDLIRHTRSCARVHDMTILHPHCGHCSQCLDRRFAILAAGLEQEDPEEAYRVDLFTGERPPGPDREMALAYVRSATTISRMTDVAFFARYGDASRAVGFFAEPSGTVAERIFDLYRRHAAAVCQACDRAITFHASALREQSLPPSCLLSLTVGRTDPKTETGSSLPVLGSTRSPRQPVDPAVSSAPAPTHRDIRMAIDAERKRIVFDRWDAIEGVSAELLILLAEPFQEALWQGLAPERYPFMPTGRLLERLRVASAETLRRRVLRCRREIERLARDAGEAPPSIDAMIETNQRHGYRLNPDRVRIIKLADIGAGSAAPAKPSGYRSTQRARGP